MNNVDKQYLDILKYVLGNGELSSNRTGIDTLSVFGVNMKFDLSEGFPALTTKKMYFKAFIHELLWFLKGDTNVKYLQDNGVRIWNEWANEDGELVSCYGKQWRRWEAIDFNNCSEINGEKKYGIRKIDQIAYVINEIKNNPTSRRIVCNAWNPSELDMASLPWCHSQFQFKVSWPNGKNNKGKLNCHLLQRSGDFFLGIPANIISYAFLTHMIAQVCNLDVGILSHTIIDCHLYVNHIEQAKEQLNRGAFKLPELWLNQEVKNINDFKYDDIKILNYESHSAIKASVAI